MKKILGYTASLSLVALLATGMTGCGNNSPGSNNQASPSASATPTAEVQREDRGYMAAYADKLALKDKKEFSDDNYLRVGEDNDFKITAYGFLETDQQQKSPADGEVFHAINYTYKPVDVPYNQDPPKVTLTVNGETKALSTGLSKEGTLLVSAPKDDGIELNIQRDGVTQTIGFKDAERKTKDIAQAWYEPSEGKLTDANVKLDTAISGYTATLKYTVKDAVRTAYDPADKLGWADNGKKAWVILNLDNPKWTVSKDSVTKSYKESKITLKDAKGKEYTAVTSSASGSEETKAAFEVPVDMNDFTLHTENSVELDLFGKTIGTTDVLTADQVKISFESGK
jgi:hypothetical protein